MRICVFKEKKSAPIIQENIKHDHKKFSRHGNQALRICPRELANNKFLNDVEQKIVASF